MEINFLDFKGFDLLSQEQVRELVGTFSQDGDLQLRVSGRIPRAKRRRSQRGLHEFYRRERLHRIYLSRNEIIRGFCSGRPIGGNFPARSLRLAAAMVTVHEIEHANQAFRFSPDSPFYSSGDYLTRPSESCARSFVDSNMGTIESIMGLDSPKQLEDEELIGGALRFFEQNNFINSSDIVEWLTTRRLEKDIRFDRIVKELGRNGKGIVG